jgi:pyrimidine deaminase RibD-like protein
MRSRRRARRAARAHAHGNAAVNATAAAEGMTTTRYVVVEPCFWYRQAKP